MVDSLRDWLAEHPPPDAAFTQTLARVAERAREGDDFRFAVRELLDECALLPRPNLAARAIADRPRPTGDARQDAFLGALAEHLALRHGVPRPAWCCEPDRFLDRMWFPNLAAGFRAMAIAQAPAAFARRGIFLPERSLERI